MKLSNSELDVLLEDLKTFNIEIDKEFNSDEGSNVYRKKCEIKITNLVFLNFEVVIVSSWVPSRPINDGGHLKFEAPEVTHVINFDGITSLNLDGESIITDAQALEIEARLQYLINIE